MNDEPVTALAPRLPPTNLQAEQALLGAILANNRAFGLVSGFLRPEHFADPIHARIYKQCAALILRGQLVDAVTLKAVFANAGVLDEVGGTPYLAQLLTAMVGIANAGDYGRAIHDCWLRRKLIEIGEEAQVQAYGADPDVDGEGVLQATTDHLMELSGHASKDQPAVSLGDAARRAIQAAEAMHRGDPSPALLSGFEAVDEALGGFWPANLYVLGGRPRMGKTALGLQLAIGVAEVLEREAANAPPFSGAGGLVVVYSLEMPADELGGRAVSLLAGIHGTALQRGDLRGDAPARLIKAQRELDALPLEIIDGAGMSATSIALRTRAMAQRRRVRLVVIDHLSKIIMDQAAAKHGPAFAVAQVTSTLKNLARQLKAPVLLLAQLGRDVDKRDDPRPRLSDLMYAGEADADTAAFLFRQELYLPKRPPDRHPKENDEQYSRRREQWAKRWDECRGRAELIVAKRRQGAEGVVLLGFDGELTSFRTLGEAPDVPPDLWDGE